MEPFGIALIGCGTVGGGVARLLLEQQDRLAARADDRGRDGSFAQPNERSNASG